MGEVTLSQREFPEHLPKDLGVLRSLPLVVQLAARVDVPGVVQNRMLKVYRQAAASEALGQSSQIVVPQRVFDDDRIDGTL